MRTGTLHASQHGVMQQSRAITLDAVSATTGPLAAYWALRLGAAFCFIGHGAFGFITKAAWIPYFGVVGIPEPWAWRLMPVVGAIDVMAGMAVLFAPRALPLVYMTVWALWTALLRPLSGESVFETLERAGNYGVPLALMFLTMVPRSVAGLVARLDSPTAHVDALDRTRQALKWTTVILLVGHGALGIADKALLTTHYTTIGLPAGTTVIVGWFEMLLAGARRRTGVR